MPRGLLVVGPSLCGFDLRLDRLILALLVTADAAVDGYPRDAIRGTGSRGLTCSSTI
jgi:hypothetical protein